MNTNPLARFEIGAPLFVGDDLALDFVNTAFGVGEDRRECLGSDAQVLDWLQRAGLPASAQRGAGRPGTVLALGNAYRELVWSKSQSPSLELRRRVSSVEALLVPVAEAVANLLAEGDFSLVRKCESADCTLWFYDRTKSHHRRWCSMAQCGNRMKVAAFRARRKAE